jgi:hypothetical protein
MMPWKHSRPTTPAPILTKDTRPATNDQPPTPCQTNWSDFLNYFQDLPSTSPISHK